MPKLDDALQGYELRDADNVVQFMIDHMDLLPLLERTPGEVEKAFGEPMAIALELMHDYDGAGEYLVAYIQTEQEVEAADACMDRFDDGWWAEAMWEADGDFLVSLEFV